VENYERASDNDEFEFDIDDDTDDDTNEDNYAIAVKCIFGKPKNIMGAFCLLLRRHDSKVIELVLWTTKSIHSDELELNLTMPWEDFSTKIPSIGPIDKESCDKLKNALKDKLSKVVIDSIFDNHSSNTTSFSSELRVLFETTMRYSIKLDLKFELFHKERLRSSGYEREDSSPNINAENVTMSQIIAEQIDTQIVNCTAIVDPVNGIAASHLKVGDIVKVILQKNSTIGTLLSDHYTRLNKVPAFPVKKVSRTESGVYIISLEADAGVTCVIKTTSDLKLRASRGYDIESSLSGRNLMIILGAGAAVFIIALIALIRLFIR